MKPLDLLEQFDKAAAGFGFIATYEFDPQFFERRILAKRTFGSADRLVIFMDKGRYQELINSGLQSSGFNRRYLVIPMDRAPEVFHPKLYLALGEKRADGLIGSSNCTNAGIAYNLEICSTFSVTAEASATSNRDAQSILRQIYEAMKVFARDSGSLRQVLENEFFRPVEDLFAWLHPKVMLPASAIQVVHSHERALWPELIGRLKGYAIRKVTIISPFYDQDLGLLYRLKDHWPQAELTVVAQPDYATLDGEELEKLFGAGPHNLLAAHLQPGRRLHAKAFAFETEDETFWFSGSANATRAAFDGRNTEAALWVSTKETADEVLGVSGLKLERTKPSEFRRGAEQVPPSENKAANPITLLSAVLREDGVLECEFNAPDQVRDLAIRVRNINESHPVFSLPLRRSTQMHTFLNLDDNQISQIRAAAVCEIRATVAPEVEAISNATSLVQLPRDKQGESPASIRMRIAGPGEGSVFPEGGPIRCPAAMSPTAR